MKAVSLFCGAGGLDEPFDDVRLAIDSWNLATATYKANHPNTQTITCDISQYIHNIIQKTRSISPDIILGGPPCQDFSKAGKRRAGLHADLTTAFTKIATSVRPEWIVYENVSTIQTIGKRYVDHIVNHLRLAGYGITAVSLDAADFGVPQYRKRFFIIAHLGYRDDEFVQDILNQQTRHVSIAEYCPDIISGDNSTRFYYRHPWSYASRAIYTVHEPSQTIRGINPPIPKRYKIHPNDATDDLSRVRILTTHERSLIQTFPKEYTWVGHKTYVDHLIGNAVPPKLARVICDVIS